MNTQQTNELKAVLEQVESAIGKLEELQFELHHDSDIPACDRIGIDNILHRLERVVETPTARRTLRSAK